MVRRLHVRHEFPSNLSKSHRFLRIRHVQQPALSLGCGLLLERGRSTVGRAGVPLLLPPLLLSSEGAGAMKGIEIIDVVGEELIRMQGKGKKEMIDLLNDNSFKKWVVN